VRWWLPAAFVLAVLGCARAPVIHAPSDSATTAWQTRQNKLHALKDWEFIGRVVIHSEAEGWNGTLRWIQHPNSYRIDFIAPLGQASLKLLGDEYGAELRLSDDKVVYADDADDLFYTQLGWSLPISAMRYWVVGRTVQNKGGTLELDPQGRLQHLIQEGWSIDYKRYTEAGEYFLPEKIFMEHDQLGVRIVVDHWKI
jgi:outer membrane lipoprotein LolB